jgi:hypothetical protein
LIKINIYNSNKTSKLLESKKNIESVIEIVRGFKVKFNLIIKHKETVESLQKAMDNAKGDNLMACLRILNGLKSKNILAQPAGPAIRKLFSLFLPLIMMKITMFTDDLLNKWMTYLKGKKSKFSEFLLSQIEDSSRKRLSKMNSRMSIIGRGNILVMKTI